MQAPPHPHAHKNTHTCTRAHAHTHTHTHTHTHARMHTHKHTRTHTHTYTYTHRYVPQAHFNTDARRLLFESYAEHVMVAAGVHIWDVYAASSAGFHKLSDMMHVSFHTIRWVSIEPDQAGMI